ncbi:MAG: GNAT family N-acetyltransferase [Prevotella sp.]|nr:GNAT family N-acetyltransferase [Prevotella sp.]
MKIELATIQDVPELQELQHKAFGPQCIELGWEDAPPMTESLEHAYEDFAQCTTLKVLDDEGRIIGSIRGNVTDGSLYMGRLMVLPEYRQQGIGKQLFREIQSRLPHNRAWLCTCKQVQAPYEFYLREGFRPYKDEIVGPGLTWVYMEKSICILPKDNSYQYVTLRERPEMKDMAATWFHDKWSVPKEAYLECMDAYLSGETEYGWYLCLNGSHIIGGMGVIENDFHDRKDLSPNVCAVYTEEEYRCQGIAGKLLNIVVEDMRSKKITPLYLVTNHTGFYERYGWEFLCLVQSDGEPKMSRMYIHK